MARITLYGRDLRFVALATGILKLCPLSYTLAFRSLCETGCSIICSTTSAIRRFTIWLLHSGCIVYRASKLCCLVIVLYTTVRRVPIMNYSCDVGTPCTSVYMFWYYASLSPLLSSQVALSLFSFSRLAPSYITMSYLAQPPIIPFKGSFSPIVPPFSFLYESLSPLLFLGYCSAQTQTGIGHLRKPPVIELIPCCRTRRKLRYEANKCGWSQPLFCKARDRGIN